MFPRATCGKTCPANRQRALVDSLSPDPGEQPRKGLIFLPPLRGAPGPVDVKNPMHTMMPSRTAELQACRVRLASEPAAVAEARSPVRAAIAAWNAPVDQDVAVLLAGELVTNAIRHAAGESVMLGIRCTRDRLRVDVHTRSSSPPVLANASADAEGGRGLMLVVGLSAEWGYYRIPMGKVVYFTLAFDPDLTGGSDMTSDGETPPARPAGRGSRAARPLLAP